MRMGFACIVTELNDLPKDKRVTTNRSMIKRTFLSKGMDYASEMSLMNCKDLLKILKWNKDNDFNFFRMSSNMFPWASEYELEDLKDFEDISKVLKKCGDFAKENDIRLTFHPGPFNKLCSSDERIVGNTIKDLENHGKIFDLMGLSRTHYNKINIHVGGAYGDREAAAAVFCKNFERLSDSVKSRLTVENDDRASLFSTKDLFEMVYSKVKIPIVHDLHHHDFCTGDIDQEEALNLAISTWGKVTPVVHYSESRTKEYEGVKKNAHSDYIYDKIETFGLDVDIMVEAKKKELAVKKYRKMYIDS